MFDKILIANRGEIACRIMRTAHALGIHTVAVYSDADASAMHVALADEAIRIGPAPVAESYLLGDVIINAALSTGAQAIHPGYGFLSENPDFVDKVVAAGLRFIGPSADAIRAMGLKDAAKNLMQKAGVPVVPGYHGDNQDADYLAGEAAAIGYPVLIKARAGGGGKGMRRVDQADDFSAALQSAMREAQAAFGDDACLIEKYITSPRHIEIQVFGDDHGNVVHLFERDCSLQRRHQKVIEEAPAPGMNDKMREAMGSAAVTACKAISYSGAGTIEFIVDASDGLRPDRFWFMEMNTRLQVEHPVTEAITHQDLVEWQLRVAAGENLPLSQDQLKIDGWAFESRLYAEDVNSGFLPAIGTIEHLRFATTCRVDTGIRQGDTITPYYDPMIAKLISHGATRDAALGQMRRALGATRIAGSTTNADFLKALCTNPDFAQGNVDTGLIERDLDQLLSAGSPPAGVIALAAVGALGLDSNNPPLCGFSLWQPLSQTVTLRHSNPLVDGDGLIAVRVETLSAQSLVVTVDGVSHLIELIADSSDRFVVDGSRISAEIVRSADCVTVFMHNVYAFTVPDALVAEQDQGDGGDKLVAPMPGQLKVINASAGDAVAEGEALMVMEAMKMEHTLVAPRDGTVAEVMVSLDDQVEAGALLLTLEQRESD